MNLALTVEIHQAPGGRHQDIDQLALELLALAIIVDAADQGNDVNVCVARQVFGVLGDLHHQFAGRRDDQRPRFARVARLLGRVVQQVAQYRQQKRRRLAGSRLRLADTVIAKQGMRQDLLLDGRAVAEAEIVDRFQQRFRQPQFAKAYRGRGWRDAIDIFSGLFLHSFGSVIAQAGQLSDKVPHPQSRWHRPGAYYRCFGVAEYRQAQ